MPGRKSASKSAKSHKGAEAKRAAVKHAAPARAAGKKAAASRNGKGSASRDDARPRASKAAPALPKATTAEKMPKSVKAKLEPVKAEPAKAEPTRTDPAKKAAAARTPATAARPAARTAVAAPVARAMPRSADAEEAEGGDHSLLAGPRNVKPYVAKRGEQYMGRQQLEHFRTILQSWKRDLMVEVDRTVTHMKDEAANFPDPNDRATQEEEFSLELRTRDRERKLIRKIDEALKRIEDGSYGYCLETGEEIGVKRLEARPVATLSIEAQERRERRERQYGDRDDRYR